MPILLGVAAAFAYGIADFMARFSAERIGVRGALFGMLLSGSIAISAWYLLAGLPLLPLALAWPWLVLSGALSLCALGLLYAAIQRGPIGVASPIVAAHPALVLLLLWLGTELRPSALEWTGLGITLAGALLLSTQVDDIGRALSLESRHARRTAALAAACAIFVAFQVLCVQHAARVAGAVAAAWGSRVFALLALLVVLPFGPSFPARARGAWTLAALQGVLDAGAMLAVAAGSSGTDRAIVPVVASAFSAVTVILARFVLKERVAALQWGAIACILLGVGVLGASE